MVVLDRFKSGDIQQRRTCTVSPPGARFVCEDPSDPNHLVYCCYDNMCNVNVSLTFPTVKTSDESSHSNNGEYHAE